MSDLREQLADRLRELIGEIRPPHQPQNQVYERLADECIRQMEWARRDGFALAMRSEGMGEDWNSCGCDVREYGSHASDCWRTPLLSLAPEDWKP